MYIDTKTGLVMVEVIPEPPREFWAVYGEHRFGDVVVQRVTFATEGAARKFGDSVGREAVPIEVG